MAVDLVKVFLKQRDSIENVAFPLIDFVEKMIFNFAE